MEQSPETRIALLEQSQRTIMEKIDEIILTLSHFEDKLDKALEKKADVWVEQALKWFISIIMSTVLLAIVYTVIKK